MRPRIGITCSTMDAVEGRGVRRLHVPEPYVRRVEEAGGMAWILPTTDPARAPAYLELLDGLVLIGGDDVDPSLYGAAPHPELGPVDRARDDFEVALVRAVAASRLPAFGICRGLQVMNVALGGTLHQHLPDTVPGALVHGGKMDETHAVAVLSGSHLDRILGARTVAVNSHHHQAVERHAPGLLVTAHTSDGVVEAAELPTHPFFLGVQWHPERLPEADATKRLFRAFVQAAAARVASSR